MYENISAKKNFPSNCRIQPKIFRRGDVALWFSMIGNTAYVYACRVGKYLSEKIAYVELLGEQDTRLLNLHTSQYTARVTAFN